MNEFIFADDDYQKNIIRKFYSVKPKYYSKTLLNADFVQKGLISALRDFSKTFYYGTCKEGSYSNVSLYKTSLVS